MVLKLKRVLRKIRNGPFSPLILLFSALALFLLSPGSKAAPRPGGIGSAAAGQPGMEGEGMFSKILPGGAAEQAGKLGEGMYKCKVKNNKKKTRNLFS